MASSLSKSILASVVALVVAGTVHAQDSKFQEGVKLLRLGTPEDRAKALEAFREVLKEDPSNEQALELYRSITQDEWFLLLSQQDEIQKIAASILERAKLERKERSRDEAAIETLAPNSYKHQIALFQNRKWYGKCYRKKFHNQCRYVIPCRMEYFCRWDLGLF